MAEFIRTQQQVIGGNRCILADVKARLEPWCRSGARFSRAKSILTVRRVFTIERWTIGNYRLVALRSAGGGSNKNLVGRQMLIG